MTNHTLTLTDKEVLATAQTGLAQYMPLNAEGYKCTRADLYQVLLAAGVQQTTVETVCTQFLDSPVGNTIRGYLKEQLCVEDLAQWEDALNQALVADLPTRLRRKRRVLAMDMHDRPYYGKTSQADGLWVRGRAKAGTTRFYRIATAYVVHHGLRHTVALRFVQPEDDPVTIIQKLVQRVAPLAIPLAYLLLDKGFAGIAVQDYLAAQGVRAIIACPIRGKHGGTRALCRGRKSYRTQHTFSGEQGSRTAEVAVCRAYTTAKRTKRRKRQATWLVFILINLDMQPQQVCAAYRQRFGIETGYRCANQVRGWTTSTNPVLRFLLMGLALYLVNVWVQLRWQFCQIPRRGRRQLNTRLFALARFAHFIRLAVEDHYGTIHQITAAAAPLW